MSARLSGVAACSLSLLAVPVALPAAASAVPRFDVVQALTAPGAKVVVAPQVVAGRDGVTVAVWGEPSARGGTQLLAAVRRTAAQPFSAPVRVLDVDSGVQSMRLVSNDPGLAALVVAGNDGGVRVLERPIGRTATFGAPVVLAASGGRDVSASVSEDGAVLVGWQTGTAQAPATGRIASRLVGQPSYGPPRPVDAGPTAQLQVATDEQQVERAYFTDPASRAVFASVTNAGRVFDKPRGTALPALAGETVGSYRVINDRAGNDNVIVELRRADGSSRLLRTFRNRGNATGFQPPQEVDAHERRVLTGAIADLGGDSLATWVGDPSGTPVVRAIFARSGDPFGPELEVERSGPGPVEGPSVGAGPDSFVLAWNRAARVHVSVRRRGTTTPFQAPKVVVSPGKALGTPSVTSDGFGTGTAVWQARAAGRSLVYAALSQTRDETAPRVRFLSRSRSAARVICDSACVLRAGSGRKAVLGQPGVPVRVRGSIRALTVRDAKGNRRRVR